MGDRRPERRRGGPGDPGSGKEQTGARAARGQRGRWFSPPRSRINELRGASMPCSRARTATSDSGSRRPVRDRRLAGLSISSAVSSTVVFVWTAPLPLTVRPMAAAVDASTPSTSAYDVGAAESEVERFERSADRLDDGLDGRTPLRAPFLEQSAHAFRGVRRFDQILWHGSSESALRLHVNGLDPGVRSRLYAMRGKMEAPRVPRWRNRHGTRDESARPLSACRRGSADRRRSSPLSLTPVCHT